MERTERAAGDSPLVTVGIDLAGYSSTTGVCRITWGDPPTVEILASRSDEDLLAAMESADKTGLDSPLGWPVAFVALLASHQSGAELPATARYAAHANGRSGLGTFTHRLTDDVAWKRTGMGRPPLSVSADKLGVVAMRAAHLMERLAADGPAVARDGSGPVAEVYPGLALTEWGLAPRTSYKGAGPAAATARSEILEGLVSATGLTLAAEVAQRFRRSDHDLDALVSALVARAVVRGTTELPATEHERAMASVEGWIHLPHRGVPLSDLRR